MLVLIHGGTELGLSPSTPLEPMFELTPSCPLEPMFETWAKTAVPEPIRATKTEKTNRKEILFIETLEKIYY